MFLGSSVSFFISQLLGCVVAVQWPRYVLPPAAHLGVPRSSGGIDRAATKLGAPHMMHRLRQPIWACLVTSSENRSLIVFQSSGSLVCLGAL